jgi:hypothetical protein
MEIKPRMTSSIQQNVSTENNETKQSAPAVQSGVANLRDGFEASKASSAQFQLPTESSTKLDFVKKQMGSFMTSNSAVSANDSIFSVMMEYQKLSNKEAHEDQKLARSSNHVELSAKQSKLLMDDKEIQSAKGSHDMYQVVDQEAALEFYIGQAGRLVKSDTHKDIDSMKNRLDELKKSAVEVKAEILQKGSDQDNVNKRYDTLISWIISRKDDD